jgi:hypothetical protein
LNSGAKPSGCSAGCACKSPTNWRCVSRRGSWCDSSRGDRADPQIKSPRRKSAGGRAQIHIGKGLSVGPQLQSRDDSSTTDPEGSTRKVLDSWGSVISTARRLPLATRRASHTIPPGSSHSPKGCSSPSKRAVNTAYPPPLVYVTYRFWAPSRYRLGSFIKAQAPARAGETAQGVAARDPLSTADNWRGFARPRRAFSLVAEAFGAE